MTAHAGEDGEGEQSVMAAGAQAGSAAMAINLSPEPASPLLAISPKDLYTTTGALAHPRSLLLFITARKWKQPRGLSTEEGIMEMYIYTMEYYSAVKKNEICKKMDKHSKNYPA